MALQDLKKQTLVSKSKRTKISADEFISQASLYAQGLPALEASNHDNVIDFKTGRPTFVMLGRIDETPSIIMSPSNRKLKSKNATFSLNHYVIAQLNELAQTSGLTKSHIIRVLIGEYQLTTIEEINKQFKIDWHRLWMKHFTNLHFLPVNTIASKFN